MGVGIIEPPIYGGYIFIKFSSYKFVDVRFLPFPYTVNIGKENYYVREL
jgi:hypothetical protein